MKKSIVFYFLLSLVSCKLISTEQNAEGIYTCNYEHEFAKTSDTLMLKRMSENYFKVIRHSGVVIKETGKQKIISEVWKLDYDKSKNVFTELKTGKTLVWNAENHSLIFGTREYLKND